MIAMTDQRMSVEELRSDAPGYAYVKGVVPDVDSTLVRLQYPAKVIKELALPWVLTDADRSVTQLLGHVLSVHVRNVIGVDCVALTTVQGAASSAHVTRVAVTLRQAIALAESGVHTVFLTRDPADLSAANIEGRG